LLLGGSVLLLVSVLSLLLRWASGSRALSVSRSLLLELILLEAALSLLVVISTLHLLSHHRLVVLGLSRLEVIAISGVIILGVVDHHVVGQLSSDTSVVAIRIVGKHDSHTDTDRSLSKHNVFNGFSNVGLLGFTTGDHVSLLELHGLGSSTSKFSRNDNLDTLGLSVVHDELEHTVARSSNRKATLQLVANRLGLGSRTQTSGLDLLGKNLDRVVAFKSVTQLKKLLDVRDFLHNIGSFGTFDHNLSALWSGLDFNSSVSIFGEHSLKELVDLCEK